MNIRSYLYFIRRNLTRRISGTILGMAGLTIGAFFFSLALFGYYEIREPIIKELGRAFPEKRLVVKPRTMGLGPVKLNRTKLNSRIIEQIDEIPGVIGIYPIQPVNFPVRAEGTIFGQEIMTDIAINGVPRELIEDSLSPGWAFQSIDIESDQPAPVVISRYFIDLYNFGIAQSNNLPQFNETAALGQTFDLVLGESTISGLANAHKSKRIQCCVVGFTPDVTLFGIVMPLEIVRDLNAWYHGNQSDDYTLAHVEIEDVKDFQRISGDLAGLGLLVESQKEILDQFRMVMNLISWGMIFFTFCILLLVGLNFIFSETLSLIRRREEMGILSALGAGRKSILFLFTGEKIFMGFVSGLFATGIFFLLWHGFQSALPDLSASIPLLGDFLSSIKFPFWILIVTLAFSSLWEMPICLVILYKSLFSPPARLLEK
ncbi:ABC transporter permease [Candidatus Sumerlaeota bacterium]|nr:ABC transporter permease [Candidatus Sumerlaeota bacterium]